MILTESFIKILTFGPLEVTPKLIIRQLAEHSPNQVCYVRLLR